MNQQNPTPAPTPAPTTTSTSSKSTDVKRYAAYDKALLRFVGGVHDTKAKAKKAATDKGVAERDIDVREV